MSFPVQRLDSRRPTAAVMTAGVMSGLSRLEWCVVIIAIMGVWTAEALNTAFEALCDVASPAIHPAVERAKNVAAAAILPPRRAIDYGKLAQYD